MKKNKPGSKENPYLVKSDSGSGMDKQRAMEILKDEFSVASCMFVTDGYFDVTQCAQHAYNRLFSHREPSDNPESQLERLQQRIEALEKANLERPYIDALKEKLAIKPLPRCLERFEDALCDDSEGHAGHHCGHRWGKKAEDRITWPQKYDVPCYESFGSVVCDKSLGHLGSHSGKWRVKPASRIIWDVKDD